MFGYLRQHGVLETVIKKLKLTAKNEKIYLSYKKKGQENKVLKTENQTTAHFEASESESGNCLCLKKKCTNEDQWTENVERAACSKDK